MRAIEKTVYKFEELSDKAKDNVRDYFSRDFEYAFDWRDELNDSPVKDSLIELSKLYTENSQGPYFDGDYRKVFQFFMNYNAGNIKRLLNSDYHHPIELAFISDAYDYFENIEWDDELFVDWRVRFYPSHVGKAIYNWFYENWEWERSDEYLIDLCDNNEYEFFEDGTLL